MIRKVLIGLGLAPSAEDKKLRDLVNASYASLRVTGRGTVKIDPAEVYASPEFKAARRQAARIVKK